jgi:hypothetical protein
LEKKAFFPELHRVDIYPPFPVPFFSAGPLPGSFPHPKLTGKEGVICFHSIYRLLLLVKENRRQIEKRNLFLKRLFLFQSSDRLGPRQQNPLLNYLAPFWRGRGVGRTKNRFKKLKKFFRFNPTPGTCL